MTESDDSAIANTDARSLPTASSTATRPSVHNCIEGLLGGVESELPTPRRSVRINRLKDARR